MVVVVNSGNDIYLVQVLCSLKGREYLSGINRALWFLYRCCLEA